MDMIYFANDVRMPNMNPIHRPDFLLRTRQL